jgi:hypothetical protein
MEIVVGIIISIALGWGLASKKEEPVKPPVTPTKATTPYHWPAGEHQNTMMICRTMCNSKVLRYEPATGECECKNNSLSP